MTILATGLTTDHETKAGAHPISGVTGLQAALDGKYSPTNKPTAADVGALPITGGTLEGGLLVMEKIRCVPLNAPGFTITGNGGGYSELAHVDIAGTHDWTNSLRSHGASDWRIGSNRLYHQGYKPTAADIQNVVSPVSAGGIIERGSNANGRYTKFMDGTLVVDNSGAAVVTNPVTFVGAVTSVDSNKLRFGYWK